jgi:hypothetical protein
VRSGHAGAERRLPSSNLRLFVGEARGGLKCVSGVCRLFPPFQGVKLTATVRF